MPAGIHQSVVLTRLPRPALEQAGQRMLDGSENPALQ